MVFAVDYTLDNINTLLNDTMGVLLDALEGVQGTMYVVENSGELVGVSSGTDVVVDQNRISAAVCLPACLPACVCVCVVDDGPYLPTHPLLFLSFLRVPSDRPTGGKQSNNYANAEW